MSSLIQPALPGMRPAAPRRRASSHARVWGDPAVVASRAATDRAVGDWRRSFAAFVAGLPAERRDELRRRLGVADQSADAVGRATSGDATAVDAGAGPLQPGASADEREAPPAPAPAAPAGGLCPPHHWVITTAYIDGVAHDHHACKRCLAQKDTPKSPRPRLWQGGGAPSLQAQRA